MGDSRTSLPMCPSDRAPGGDGLTDTTVNTATETAARRVSPLGHFASQFADGPDEVRLREVPFLAQVNLRVDPSGPEAARLAPTLGARLPIEPNTAIRTGEHDVLWLGPDEWLVVGPDGAAERIADAVRNAIDGSAESLGGGVGGEAGSVASVASVVDVSAQRTVIEVAGARARELLAKGCSLDLHPRVFGSGQCAQTLLARAGVIVLPRGGPEPVYWVLVRATFAEYLAWWLVDARREYEPVGVPDGARTPSEPTVV